MSKQIVLSIVIVSYNTQKITLQCIDSIQKFPPKVPFEVIVVDNNSSDDSKEMLKKKKVILIENSQNLGFSKANNIGIKAAKGKYIMLLNSDTKVTNNVLTELVSFAEDHPDAGLIAPRLLNVDKTVQPSVYNAPTITRAIMQYWLKQGHPLDKYTPEFQEPVKVEMVVAAAVLITQLALKKVGMLKEKYFMYFEDLDYCREVTKAGLSIYYLPSSTITHLHGASGGQSVNKLLIESSKKYFGNMRYYLYTFILWSGQKLQRIFS